MGSVILEGVVPLGAFADETFWGLECHCIAETATEE